MDIQRPGPGEHPEYMKTYVDKVEGDVIENLNSGINEFDELLDGRSEAELQYRYEEGKWTIKEILAHIIDAERVFAYRALRIARNDKTDLPGFDHNDYIQYTEANTRSLGSLLRELKSVRAASVKLFENLPLDSLERVGSSSGNPLSVRALAYVIAGHANHHLGVIRERYIR